MKGQSVQPYQLRPLAWADLDQISDIEREAFPTLWPPSSFKREMRNRIAQYVVCVHKGVELPPQASERPPGLLGRVLRWLGMAAGPAAPPGPRELVVGFVGLWYMADEAHIVSIAVREGYRGQGLGELLLLGALELVAKQEQQKMTLEVRASNTAAQRLYQKYGFQQAGLRKGYYSDNREDAVIMSTDPFSPDFQEWLEEIRVRYEERYGAVERQDA